ncbi:unnamed protein product [Adineta steineri]|uniref:CCHC-type domain-containing protein n=1 Tax=Adineta steineri TaxID=433720 RepID=A0A815RX44_9BILA|nr:unnamed protein product [Adineta steineri]CAF1483099.1 unnamed protein product [Adineta steineri]
MSDILNNNNYKPMATEEDDPLCDKDVEIIQEIIIQNDENGHNANKNYDLNNINKDNSKFKRQLTSNNQYGEDIQEIGNNPIQVFTKPDRSKQQKLNNGFAYNVNENNDTNFTVRNSPLTNNSNGRLFYNTNRRTSKSSNMQRNDRNVIHSHHNNSTERKNICQNISAVNDPCQNNINISHQALNYAVEQHLPPIYIQCDPKLTDHLKGKEIIKGIFEYIEKRFRSINKHYKLPLGFDYWYINKNGDLVCYTRHSELFVYLCDPQKYPKTINSVDILPSKPKHLPGDHSLILKYVPNYITLNDIQKEIGLSIDSIFNLEEVNGTKTEKYRHVRMEINSTLEYKQLLDKGGITIDSLLIQIKEFLAPPRILICTRCNDPGHIRKNCRFEYEACRRCGEDRSVGEHKDCTICCHRCKQQHMATDFKCQYLIDYRRSLLFQLQQNPQLLPPNVQIFIPTEYRMHGNKSNRFITNPLSNNSSLMNNSSKSQTNKMSFNSNSHAWPLLNNDQFNNNNVNNIDKSAVESIWSELKIKQIEIDKLKENFDIKIQNLQSKYNDKVSKLKTALQIMTAQSKDHNENIGRCYSTMIDFIPLMLSTLEAFKLITLRVNKSNTNDDNNDDVQIIIHKISKSIEYMKEHNNLLISNQKSINDLIDKQGQLLAQAVNSISINDE